MGWGAAYRSRAGINTTAEINQRADRRRRRPWRDGGAGGPCSLCARGQGTTSACLGGGGQGGGDVCLVGSHRVLTLEKSNL